MIVWIALRYTSPDGRLYSLTEKSATLIVRPRGWHLEENTRIQELSGNGWRLPAKSRFLPL